MPGPLSPLSSAPIGLAAYPGVVSVESATYTLSHGITPGVCSMTIAPQPGDKIAITGPLAFTFGKVALIFPGFKVDLTSLRYDSLGAVVTLSLVDRRWKWAFGQLSGQFNQREWDGTILQFHQRTPQQLASLCLDTMGELGYDVSQIPNDNLPAVTWNVIPPMQALADLCDSLGCRVVLRLDGTVNICRVGVGLSLPVSNRIPIANFGQNIKPPARPDSVVIICSKNRCQVDLPLEPVVQDFSALPVPYQQASYTPPGGWVGVIPGVCSQIVGAPFGRAYDLAINSFCLWYRIVATNLDDSVPLILPGYGPVLDFRQLTILPDQVFRFIDNDASIRPVPAWVYGSYVTGQVLGPYAGSGGVVPFTNSTIKFGDVPETIWWRGFSLDPEKGLVVLNYYAYRVDAAGNIIPAKLYLRTSVNVVSFDAWEPARYQRRKDYPDKFGTQPQYLQHDEIEYQALPLYNAAGAVFRVLDNSPEVNAEADYYLKAADLQFQTTDPQEIDYLGILPISPDGAIQQITWTVGTQTGAHTHASRNNEFSTATPPYRLRRVFEQLRSGALAQIRQAVAAAAQKGLVPGRNGL